MRIEHTGVVDEWIHGSTGGWGFLRSDYQIPNFVHNRKDRRIFVHRDNIHDDLGALVAGQKVAFKVKPPIHRDGRDWQATDVRVLEDAEAAADAPPELPAGKRPRRKRDRGGGDADKKAKPAKVEPSTVPKAEKSEPPPLDPITPDEGEDDDVDAPSKGRMSVVHGILGRMKVHTIPHYGQIIPLSSVAGDFPSTVPVEALVWEPKEVPDAEPTWEARPVEPSLLPLQRIAGMKAEDANGSAKLTLHFVLCREHAAIGLKTATVGPIGRDTRYTKFIGPKLDENELIRMGLREPKELAPLETGQESGNAVTAESEGNARKADDADGAKVDPGKGGNDDKKPGSGIHFHQGQGPQI